jgi:chemotaxis protein MotB
MSASRRIRHTGSARDRWLVPYADLVTLLFAFFTALYAVTSVDATRVGHIADGVRAAVGMPEVPLVPGVPMVPEVRTVPEVPRVESPPVDDARRAIEEGLAEELQSQRLELFEDRRGLVLAIPEAGSFDTGKADLTPVAQELMRRIAVVLADLPNAIRVEGHTDDTPIRTARFESNWDLSTGRATTVVAFFIEHSGIAADRLSAAGYSQYRPRGSNDSVAGRARNRRVDVVVLNVATAAAEEPTAESARP